MVNSSKPHRRSAPRKAAPKSRSAKPARKRSESAPRSPSKRATRKPQPKKRGPGRPKGSIKLSSQDRLLLLTAIESGASESVAARAAGIDPRTFRTWAQIARKEHPTRRATPYLIELFKDIEEARARARIRREIDVANRDPKHWLRYQAPSVAGQPGWTAPVPEEPETTEAPTPYNPTPAELSAIIRALVDAGGIENPFTDTPAEPPEEEETD